jgi:hypothetical protein
MGFGQARGGGGNQGGWGYGGWFGNQGGMTRRVYPTTAEPGQTVPPPSTEPTAQPGIAPVNPATQGPLMTTGFTVLQPGMTKAEMRQRLIDFYGGDPGALRGVTLGPESLGMRPSVNPAIQNPLMSLFGGPMGGAGLLAQSLLGAIFRRMMGGW